MSQTDDVGEPEKQRRRHVLSSLPWRHSLLYCNPHTVPVSHHATQSFVAPRHKPKMDTFLDSVDEEIKDLEKEDET